MCVNLCVDREQEQRKKSHSHHMLDVLYAHHDMDILLPFSLLLHDDLDDEDGRANSINTAILLRGQLGDKLSKVILNVLIGLNVVFWRCHATMHRHLVAFGMCTSCRKFEVPFSRQEGKSR